MAIDMNTAKSTKDVAAGLGVSARTLFRVLKRRPDLRPDMFLGYFAWSNASVAAVRDALAEAREKRKRPGAANSKAPGKPGRQDAAHE